MDFELDISDDFEFYLNETIAGITDDKLDMDMHRTSKFLFYHFNNLRRDLGEEAYKISLTKHCFRQSTCIRNSAE